MPWPYSKDTLELNKRNQALHFDLFLDADFTLLLASWESN